LGDSSVVNQASSSGSASGVRTGTQQSLLADGQAAAQIVSDQDGWQPDSREPDSRQPDSRIQTLKAQLRPTKGDLKALVALMAVPVLIVVPPALAGRAVLPGDDRIQNYPLRVFAGQAIAHGHLPLWNPFIWSGSPLLAGFNAGALYPLTFLFAFLPAMLAWVINQLLIYWVASVGMYLYLRALRIAPLAAGVGSATFSLGGAMLSQLVHLGFVQGSSWLPWVLLACLELVRAIQGERRRAGFWWALLAFCVAFTVLSGSVRAMADLGVLALLMACWAIWRGWEHSSGRGALKATLWLASAGAVGFCMAAIQALPGVAFVDRSQRAATTLVSFGAGSLPKAWLLMLVMPDVAGGSHILYQPGFLPTYNLTEVSGYAGLLALGAFVALLPYTLSRRKGEVVGLSRLFEAGAVLAVFLALGNRTPLGDLLVHIPFYGGQRLQSRNLMLVDLFLAVLIAVFIDLLLRDRQGHVGRYGELSKWSLVGASSAPVAAIGLSFVGLFWPDQLERWLGARPGMGRLGVDLRPWFFLPMLLGIATLLWLWRCSKSPSRGSRWWLVALIVADLGLSGAASGPALIFATHKNVLPNPALVAKVRQGAHGGRFAIDDPLLTSTSEQDFSDMIGMGQTDLNVLTRLPSAQGYGSLVWKRYNDETHSHPEDTVGTRALYNLAGHEVDLSEVLTLPAMVLSPQGSAPLDPPYPPLGRLARAEPSARAPSRVIGPMFFGREMAFSSLLVPASQGTIPAELGILGGHGDLDWIRASESMVMVSLAGKKHQVEMERLTPVEPVVGAGVAWGLFGSGHFPGPEQASQAEVVTSAGTYGLSGTIQVALHEGGWHFAGMVGRFGRFERAPLEATAWLERPSEQGVVSPGRSLPSLGSARVESFSPFGGAVTLVHAKKRALLVRSVSWAPGWRAIWRPVGGGAGKELPVHRVGLLQAVLVPAGNGTVSWIYDPPKVKDGGLVGLVALVVVAFVVLGESFKSRLRQGTRGAIQGDLPGEAS